MDEGEKASGNIGKKWTRRDERRAEERKRIRGWRGEMREGGGRLGGDGGGGWDGSGGCK